MTITLAAAADISPALLGSTQGQWWGADYLGMPNTERRVRLVSSWRGLHMWTASFRNEKTGQYIGQRFFAAEPKTNKIVAVFNTLQEEEAWFAKQNKLHGFRNTF
jgi:hypothetical protein